MRFLLICVVALVMAVPVPPASAKATAGPPERGRILQREGGQVNVKIPAASPADVEKAERARFDAMIRGDLAALERMLHEDLTYVHSNARRETKAEFLNALKSGTLKYVSIEPVEIDVRTFGPTVAVIVGHARIKTLSQGKENPFNIRYTDVWVLRDGRWQLAAWQSTRIAE